MTSRKKMLIWILGAVFLALAINFIYINIIIPAPFRAELAACLDEARALTSETEIDSAENICFRTYPHFN